jgi:AcrR family transcriptional regulator
VEETLSLRERKKRSTRRALVAAAARLFAEKGYAQTTVAEIADAAEVSTKTLFNYFAGKDDILFVGDQQRVDAVLRTVADHGPDERPADLLARIAEDNVALITSMDGDADLTSAVNPLRIQLLMTVPELQARRLRQLQDVQLQLADALHQAYPDRLDPITAAGMVGALMGAAQTASLVSLAHGDSSPEQLRAAVRQGFDIAMLGVRAAASIEADGRRPGREAPGCCAT